jgi:hypothetical protein
MNEEHTYNVIFTRDLDLWSPPRLRVTRKEIAINALSIEDATKEAKKMLPKGFILFGIKTIEI